MNVRDGGIFGRVWEWLVCQDQYTHQMRWSTRTMKSRAGLEKAECVQANDGSFGPVQM